MFRPFSSTFTTTANSASIISKSTAVSPPASSSASAISTEAAFSSSVSGKRSWWRKALSLLQDYPVHPLHPSSAGALSAGTSTSPRDSPWQPSTVARSAGCLSVASASSGAFKTKNLYVRSRFSYASIYQWTHVVLFSRELYLVLEKRKKTSGWYICQVEEMGV
ncbi:hypothetical protein DM02DRAFT_364581 [Periconia macrospinosa]|uniref:Uncharacterized protein n=1 Tax=Periconia macrospinosa TaxID=97972 RepID=A0A2V1CZP8_9PLEO|nr:hypothetical protein DM02DRAFT_364581 [Periconia macrospinosa]